MWPSIKHWRDWAMHNLWSLARIGPQPQALHYSFEKAGLTLHDQPIPWNAEVVLVETLVRLPPAVSRRKADYTLRLPGRDPVPADSLRRQPDAEDCFRLCFRLPPPEHSVTAEICYHQQLRGQLTLPVLSRDEFLHNLQLRLPSLFVRLGEHNVACQTFVSTQCRGLLANGLLTSPTSLVPLLDLGLHVAFQEERGGPVQEVPARLCSSQLAERQALISVEPRRFPRRIGTWIATWKIGEHVLASQRVRAISQRTFQRSLRVSDTRFVVEKHGAVSLSRQVPPLREVERLGPCFLVSSKEPGMAGLCALQVRVQANGHPHPELPPQEVLITDGPTLVTPGTLAAADMEAVSAFDLLLKSQLLGQLPLSPVPVAAFTAEGGFKPPPEYSWSLAADDELTDRLSRLLEGGKE